MKTKIDSTIHWSLLTYEDWNMYVATTVEGLCYVGSHNKPFEELYDWVHTRFPSSIFIQDDVKLQPYVTELIEYLQGERKSFTVPSDYYGTPFQVAVWNALSEIPYGQTKSYSEIANYIQKPASVRAVGTAIGANPILITVPCHRVIGKNGALTGYRGGLDMKAMLLQLELEGASIERSPLHA
jgi:methylated-DNA-[protein]-cysteine S-methyltransferase